MKISIFISHNRCNVVNEFLLFCKKKFQYSKNI